MGCQHTLVHRPVDIRMLFGKEVVVGTAQHVVPPEAEGFLVATIQQQITEARVLGVDDHGGVIDNRLQQLLIRAQGALGLLPLFNFLSERPIGRRELRGTLVDACFQLGVQVSDGRLGTLAFANLALQLLINDPQGCRARPAQRLGNQASEQDRRNDGGQGGNDLDHSGEPIARLPDGPDLHEVRRTAGDDKDGETDKYPAELQVRALTDKVEQGKWNGEVGEGNDRVRSGM